MKKLLIIFLVFILFTGCEKKAPEPTVSSPEASSPDETLTGSLPMQENDNDFNEAHFTEFMQIFCRFVNLPTASAQELEKEDLLFLWMSEAELYAQHEGKTYSGSGEEASIYRFPEGDLAKISELILGYAQDFSVYEDEAYFADSSYTINYFEPQEKMFYLGFVSPLFKINAEGFLTSLTGFSSLELSDDMITATCTLSDSVGLGTESLERTVIYNFQMIQEDDLPYYRFLSLQTD